MVTQNSPNSPKCFHCETCDYRCSKKSDFDKHLSTDKHKCNINGIKCNTKLAEFELSCVNCNRKYKSRVGLWRHKKICILNNNSENVVIDSSETETLTLMVCELMKSNTELQKQMFEICNKIQPTTNINSHNNSHNKTFNLQFFLNEQCKDAMNLMDFVKSFSLQLSDLENVTKLGYVEGITGIIVKKLNEMDVHKRPIHCSDAKREILYVREDGIWEKEDIDRARLRKAIKGISKKNRILLSEWSESHPESNDIHSPMNLEYMLMIVQAMGGKGELVDNENKIMKKIMKHVLIDK